MAPTPKESIAQRLAAQEEELKAIKNEIEIREIRQIGPKSVQELREEAEANPKDFAIKKELAHEGLELAKESAVGFLGKEESPEKAYAMANLHAWEKYGELVKVEVTHTVLDQAIKAGVIEQQKLEEAKQRLDQYATELATKKKEYAAAYSNAFGQPKAFEKSPDIKQQADVKLVGNKGTSLGGRVKAQVSRMVDSMKKVFSTKSPAGNSTAPIAMSHKLREQGAKQGR